MTGRSGLGGSVVAAIATRRPSLGCTAASASSAVG